VVGERVPFAVQVLDSAGNRLAGRKVFWASENPDIATVSADGIATGVHVGAVRIAATVEGTSAIAQLTVTPVFIPVASVAVSPTSAGLVVGQTRQLQAEPRGASGEPLGGRIVVWSSSASQLVTVTSTGLVTAVAPGSATITATSEGRSGSATVSVEPAGPPPIASVSVTPSSAEVNVAWTTTLSATVRDVNNAVVRDADVAWSSTNTAVAVVSPAGVVTGIAPGGATIRASSEGKTGTASVTVKLAPVDRVEVAPAEVRIDERESVRLTATVYDARGNALTGRAVTWTSSDTRIATVDDSGRVFARREGTATITATSGGKFGLARVRVEDD
jgi:uncharacterized protein YjdB